MTHVLHRPGDPETGPEEYDLDISWVWQGKWPLITTVWVDGKVFPLTDLEIADLEERIYWEERENR